METGVTLVFYLLMGFCVAVAIWQSEQTTSPRQRLLNAMAAPVFWPFYVPILLAGKPLASEPEHQVASISTDAITTDETAARIAQVEEELDAALKNLDGPCEVALAGERGRIEELRLTWKQQAIRIRELDELLASTALDLRTDETEIVHEPASADPEQARTESPPTDKLAACERTRQNNIHQLRQIRIHLHDDLLASLACVRQLVTTIHLARFSGAPVSQTVELVRQIIAAVDGLGASAQVKSTSSKLRQDLYSAIGSQETSML